MSHVFISYSHVDEEKAFALDGRLRAENIKTFIDDVNLHPGDKWHSTLQNALDEAFAVVVICTKNAMESHEVSFEWAYAIGKGIPIIPLIYELNCPLHSRLQTLHNLDFSEPRKRPWHELSGFLSQARTQYKPIVDMLKNSGIQKIAFSRDELENEHSISTILQGIKPESELLVIARSCEAWARQYPELQNAVNSKSVQIRMAMVDPSILKEQWMIISDYAQLDVEPTLSKLRLVKIDPASKGGIELYWLPSSPLFSFVHFVNEHDEKNGVLEAGASLSLNERTILIFRSSRAQDGIMLERLHKIHSRILDTRTPAFVVKAGNDSEE